MGQELPYSCAVQISSFDESHQPIRIEATIFVERESQKGMVVGKGGSKIKSIGLKARKRIEDFIGTSVYLGLQVKTLKDWSRRAKELKRLGYDLGVFTVGTTGGSP